VKLTIVSQMFLFKVVFTLFLPIFVLHTNRSKDSSISVVTRLQAGWPSINSWQRQQFFLFTIMSRPALEPTQPPIQWIPGAISLG